MAQAAAHAPHGRAGGARRGGTAPGGRGRATQPSGATPPAPGGSARSGAARAPRLPSRGLARARSPTPRLPSPAQKTSGAMSSPPEGKLETKAGHPPAGTDWFALCLGAPGGGGAGSGSRCPVLVRCAGAQVSGPPGAGEPGAGSSPPRRRHPSCTSQNSNVGSFCELAQMFGGETPNN